MKQENLSATIYLGLLAVLIIAALFVGLVIGNWIGHARGIREATAQILYRGTE